MLYGFRQILEKRGEGGGWGVLVNVLCAARIRLGCPIYTL
jgi:hypothetical protein